jgi:hypothetical protein
MFKNWFMPCYLFILDTAVKGALFGRGKAVGAGREKEEATV